MGLRYTHLQPEERMTLASLRQQGWGIRAIATLQGRSPSTISRELRRNSCDGSYASTPAQRKSAQRKSAQRRIDARPLPTQRFNVKPEAERMLLSDELDTRRCVGLISHLRTPALLLVELMSTSEVSAWGPIRSLESLVTDDDNTKCKSDRAH